MKILARAVALFVCAFFTHSANSLYLGNANTFVDLIWNVSGPASQGCTQIIADATGNPVQGNKLIIYGVLNCPALNGGYPFTGTAYVGTDATFTMVLNMGTLVISCARMIGPNGNCRVYNASGADIGQITVRTQGW
jgi:hypothetical protein